MVTPTKQAGLYTARTHEQRRIAVLREARAQCCGCERCHDELRGEELDYLIRLSQARINELSDQITDGTNT